MQNRLFEVWLVEDEFSDVELTEEALKQCGLDVRATVISDGEKAVMVAQRQPPFHDLLRPDLILLDINLPKINGQEVLQAIRQETWLNDVPVLVVTTSNFDRDKINMEKLGSQGYVTKSMYFSEFIKSIDGALRAIGIQTPVRST